MSTEVEEKPKFEHFFEHLAFSLAGRALFQFMELRSDSGILTQLHIYFYAEIDSSVIRNLTELFQDVAIDITFYCKRNHDVLSFPVMTMQVTFDLDIQVPKKKE